MLSILIRILISIELKNKRARQVLLCTLVELE
jgi:hypothetical protein